MEESGSKAVSARHAWRRGGPIDWTMRLLCALYLAILADVTIEWGIANLAPTVLTVDGIPLGKCDSVDRFCRVIGIYPGSAGANAGMRTGDEVRYDITLDRNRVHLVGERFGATLRRSGHESGLTLVATPTTYSNRIAPLQAAVGLASFLTVLAIATLLFVRGWWRPVPMLLGCGITVVLGYTGGPLELVPFWVTPSFWTVPLLLFIGLVSRLSGLAQSAFAMRLYEEYHGSLPRWHWWALAVIAGGSAVVISFYLMHDLGAPMETDTWWLRTAGLFLFTPPSFATLTYILVGWWRSSGAIRNQYLILMIGFAILPIAIFVTRAFQIVGIAPDYAHSPVRDLLNPVVQVGFPAILAYAVLGKKLVDLGFVINRTLVYGTVSAILLVAFGLIEWAADELIKEQSRVESVAIEAGVALAIFLAFHRVRDFVEEHLEAFFFRSWHRNEAALKRFVADAAHVKRPEALKAALIAELRRFTGGTAVALYLPEGAAAFARRGGDAALPAALDVDDPVLVRLRATGQRLDPSDLGSPLPVALALPMFHRAELIGVVLVGVKPGGEHYRPDEAAALADAVHRVGLDLDALRIDAIEAETVSLRQQLAAIRGVALPVA